MSLNKALTDLREHYEYYLLCCNISKTFDNWISKVSEHIPEFSDFSLFLTNKRIPYLFGMQENCWRCNKYAYIKYKDDFVLLDFRKTMYSHRTQLACLLMYIDHVYIDMIKYIEQLFDYNVREFANIFSGAVMIKPVTPYYYILRRVYEYNNCPQSMIDRYSKLIVYLNYANQSVIKDSLSFRCNIASMCRSKGALIDQNIIEIIIYVIMYSRISEKKFIDLIQKSILTITDIDMPDSLEILAGLLEYECSRKSKNSKHNKRNVIKYNAYLCNHLKGFKQQVNEDCNRELRWNSIIHDKPSMMNCIKAVNKPHMNLFKCIRLYNQLCKSILSVWFDKDTTMLEIDYIKHLFAIEVVNRFPDLLTSESESESESIPPNFLSIYQNNPYDTVPIKLIDLELETI